LPFLTADLRKLQNWQRQL